MPVPVTRLAKQPAHPVKKKSLTCTTLPICPPGPPPSFGTREEWINSLPTWRRTKPRQIWAEEPQQGFYSGLAGAQTSAPAIKGNRAEACLPPVYSLFDGDADDEMSSDYSALDRVSGDNDSQWSNSSLEMDIDYQSQLDTSPTSDLVLPDDYERGAFTPLFEDQSPGVYSGPDVGSSPVGPVTPFGEFVDRAVASGEVKSQDYGHLVPYDQHKPAPVPEVVTPTATQGYRKLAEPLAEWVANYVWKACTTGFSLPEVFSRPNSNVAKRRSSSPPSYLPSAVHSLLLSTLLQPSAVFLAIWYIARLPVYYDAITLTTQYANELRFRAALLGSPDQEATEASAPFRLIVLGCMLANKWLDDHTFSNKTWHTISNVPIHTLNKLESLALEIFTYDLSVSSLDWSQWLAHLVSYHQIASSPPSHPQPISRPSTNPHAIVRKALDEIIQAPAAANFDPSSPQPVFMGVEERKRERMEREQARSIDLSEIDLDEDGPLREEYLPRRRISGTEENAHWLERKVVVEKELPPPARWSPAGDEPILRERNRGSGHYVAVQPPAMIPYSMAPAAYPELGYANQNWPPVGAYLAIKPPPVLGYVFDAPPLHVSHSSYTGYPLVALSHSRSHSLSYDPDNSHSRNRLRSCSQSFEYHHQEAQPVVPPPVQYGYAPPAFTCHGWLRT
ncbi:hypothetical protein MIND_00715100 [Mycena indigotica]|uniref:Cyclin N-terminal domain-containing protein n=1 Tax=Mycena indigotica TaxID=2126181 RepID=A0A8H6SNI2_9AGAR|nr:uncharacterized protein MIND_00715100 [Mycena indigotica]KAF7301497.1 hypothetical protein MIND_00715100 [Mycena indigotica]